MWDRNIELSRATAKRESWGNDEELRERLFFARFIQFNCKSKNDSKRRCESLRMHIFMITISQFNSINEFSFIFISFVLLLSLSIQTEFVAFFKIGNWASSNLDIHVNDTSSTVEFLIAFRRYSDFLFLELKMRKPSNFSKKKKKLDEVKNSREQTRKESVF